MSIGTSTVSHPSGEARAEARRHPQITNAHRGGELPRRHLPFERFGGVTDERNGDLYVINHGEVDVGSDNIAPYFIGGAAVPRARGRLSAARQLADSLLGTRRSKRPGSRGAAVPPAAHVRHRSARRRRLDVRAVPCDGHLDRDDRHPLRAPGTRLRGLDSGPVWTPDRIILASIWRRTASDAISPVAARLCGPLLGSETAWFQGSVADVWGMSGARRRTTLTGTSPALAATGGAASVSTPPVSR